MGVFKSIGEKVFRFSLAYSIMTTILAMALFVSGQSVPTVFDYTFLNPNAIIDMVNQMAGQQVSVSAPALAVGVGWSILNIALGVVLALPKTLIALASYVSPMLIPIAAFVGAFFSAMVVFYVFATWFKIDL